MVYLTALSVAQNDGVINDKLTKNDRRSDIEVYLQIIAAAHRNAARNGAESTTETGLCCHLATELLNRSVYRTDGSERRVLQTKEMGIAGYRIDFYACIMSYTHSLNPGVIRISALINSQCVSIAI
jgi:hypothetical protein